MKKDSKMVIVISGASGDNVEDEHVKMTFLMYPAVFDFLTIVWREHMNVLLLPKLK